MLQHSKIYSSQVEVLFMGSGHTNKPIFYDSLQLNLTMGFFDIDTTQPVEMQVILLLNDVSYDTFARIYQINKNYIKLEFKDAADIFDFFVGAWYLRAKSQGVIRTQFYANRHYFTPDAVKASPQLAKALVGFGIDCESLRQLRLMTSMNKCEHNYCSIVSECHEQLYLRICRIEETDN